MHCGARQGAEVEKLEEGGEKMTFRWGRVL